MRRQRGFEDARSDPVEAVERQSIVSKELVILSPIAERGMIVPLAPESCC